MKVKMNKSVNIDLENAADVLVFKEILMCVQRNYDDDVHNSLLLIDTVKEMVLSLLNGVNEEI